MYKDRRCIVIYGFVISCKKQNLSWALKHFVTQVHTLLYVFTSPFLPHWLCQPSICSDGTRIICALYDGYMMAQTHQKWYLIRYIWILFTAIFTPNQENRIWKCRQFCSGFCVLTHTVQCPEDSHKLLWHKTWFLSQYKDDLSRRLISIIFIMGIPILIRRYLYIETGLCAPVSCITRPSADEILCDYVSICVFNMEIWIPMLFQC